MISDDDYLRLALEQAILAEDDLGRVGAVFVRNGTVIAAEGSDARSATHAECMALKALKWLDEPHHKEGVVAYLTLQPCLHRTDPRNISCAQHLLRSGIRDIVYGGYDPKQPESVEFLRQHGVHIRQTANQRLQRACEELFALTYRPGVFPKHQ